MHCLFSDVGLDRYGIHTGSTGSYPYTDELFDIHFRIPAIRPQNTDESTLPF